MKLTPLHERLPSDILDLGSPCPLVLTGGYAVQAHGLVERFSRDLDVATENPAPMDEIIASLTTGLAARGRRTTHAQTDPLSGRFLDLRDRLTGADCYEDEDYAVYGPTSRQFEEPATWALEWAEDLGARIHDENA
ncbi:nucleotidyl transferase AbiEii/AbiGii toxin family protein [Streptomyces sp. NPDC091412]|uniref:nucleotidyl transferase AbiEii/AbiGii toxin family protein n=1 Tax=Streptomyces sp. NPDC091412 TaxID=3366002 RepID=UPI00380D5424